MLCISFLIVTLSDATWGKKVTSSKITIPRSYFITPRPYSQLFIYPQMARQGLIFQANLSTISLCQASFSDCNSHTEVERNIAVF